MPVVTERIYSWAVGSRLTGPIHAAAVAEAAAQFQQDPAKVWLLDAGHAAELFQDAVPALDQLVRTLPALGLERIVLVLPPPLRSAAAFLQATSPVLIHPFDSVENARAWMKRGCR